MKNKYFIAIAFILIFFTMGATTSSSIHSVKEYRISTSVHQMNGVVWIFETKYNISSGDIVSRKQVHSKKYRNVK